MPLLLTVTDRHQQTELNNWIRRFADQHYYPAELSTDALHKAIATCLPEINQETLLQDAEAQGILGSVLDVVALIRLGGEIIAWSVATDRQSAKLLQQKYSGHAYSQLRHALGINAHWILLVNPEFLFTLGDIYESHMDLIEEEERPECVIVPV